MMRLQEDTTAAPLKGERLLVRGKCKAYAGEDKTFCLHNALAFPTLRCSCLCSCLKDLACLRCFKPSTSILPRSNYSCYHYDTSTTARYSPEYLSYFPVHGGVGAICCTASIEWHHGALTLALTPFDLSFRSGPSSAPSPRSRLMKP